MGISTGWITQFIARAKADGFRKGDAILDIGAQEFFCADDPGAINRLLDHFGAEPYPAEMLPRIANSGTYARDTFLRAGLDYAAVDIIEAPGVLRLDLDRDRLPSSERGRFKFVNNAGTTEHVLNQLNAFEVIHDATAVGGVMYHGVPYVDDMHGLVTYSPKFFWSLATANGYDILDYRMWVAGPAEPIAPDIWKQIRFRKPATMQRMWHNIWLRRTNREPFRGFRDPAF